MILFATSWVLKAVPVPVTVGLPLVTATVPCRLFSGRVSAKVMPEIAQQALGLVMVKIRLEVPPTPTGFVAKFLVMVGGLGIGQPVNTMLSRFTSEAAFCAPTALILNPVVVVQVVLAAYVGEALNGVPFGADNVEPVWLYAPPF